jgi:hypothetical protein
MSDKVAEIFKTELGDYLAMARNCEEDERPSPQSLRCKILLQLLTSFTKRSKEEDPFLKLVTFMPKKLDY